MCVCVSLKWYISWKHFLLQYALYRRLPLKALSRLWGRFNQLRLPVWLRAPAFRLYIWMFSCQLDEAAVTDLRSYHNLSEFFRRQLRAGVRTVDPTRHVVSYDSLMDTNEAEHQKGEIRS